jgi:predicted DNA-binding transcriptional regulator YafY
MLLTSSRLLRLLSVLQSRAYWSGVELSEHLEVTGRTLRRDIDRLRSLGYVIESTSGPGGGYVLGKGTKLPPLMLDDDEAVAITVALRSAMDSFANLGEASVGVLAKLEQIMPARLRKRVTALQAVTVSVQRSAPATDAGLLTTLASACRDRELLELRYESRSAEKSVRRVEPLKLAHAGGRRWYLVAWDRGREAFRTFRVDRVERATPTGGTFTPRELPVDAASYVRDAITLGGYSQHATLKLRGSLEQLNKQVPEWCGVLEPLDARHCTLRLGGESLEGIVCMLVVCGMEFELLEPKEMVVGLRAIMERVQRGIETKKAAKVEVGAERKR